MQVRLLEIAGIHTRILEAGSGEPVLLLHPVGFSGDVWFRNIPTLGRRFSVCAPDMLGHGFTDLYDRDGLIGHGPVLAHVAALVDALNWDRFAVIGSSFGALVAGLLYLLMPDRVTRLMIVGSGSAVQPQAETEISLRKTLANGAAAMDAPTWENCRKRLSNLCFDAAAVHDELILSQLTGYARNGAAQSYRALLAAMSDPVLNEPYRLWGRYGEIAIPTLLLWGREDPRADHARAEKTVTLFPQARLVTFERCGHLPFLEYPDAFDGVVTDFLAGSR
jgi:pimeloyl-ACP methyl ester carboxylesterase